MDVLTPQQGTAAHAVPAVLALLCWCCFAGNLMRCVAAVPACALLSPARACCRDQRRAQLQSTKTTLGNKASRG